MKTWTNPYVGAVGNALADQGIHDSYQLGQRQQNLTAPLLYAYSPDTNELRETMVER